MRDVRTLRELGALVARWLEGEVDQPGYEPGIGPDPETLPLVPVLAAACRAGYVTAGSQPGHTLDEIGHLVQQRAAVDGIAATPVADRLERAGQSAGLFVIRHRPRLAGRADGVVVTTVNGRPITRFGNHISRSRLRMRYGDTGALDAVLAAEHVALVDPEWGRNDRLWPVLDQAIRSR